MEDTEDVRKDIFRRSGTPSDESLGRSYAEASAGTSGNSVDRREHSVESLAPAASGDRSRSSVGPVLNHAVPTTYSIGPVAETSAEYSRVVRGETRDSVDEAGADVRDEAS